MSGGDRVAVIPGDSRPTEAIADAARGADLLVFEATFLDRDADRARASMHATAFEAGTLARDADAGTLALTPSVHALPALGGARPRRPSRSTG